MMHRRWHRIRRTPRISMRDRTRSAHRDARRDSRVAIPTIPMTTRTHGAFDAHHADAIHDCAYDYYGRRVATCSSDRTIRIFDVECERGARSSDATREANARGRSDGTAADGTRDALGARDAEDRAGGRLGDANGTEGEANRARGTHVATITGHDGPVWSARWAHPKFGTLLASASFDHHVRVHKETEPNAFSLAYQTPTGTHDGSVNAIAWAPHEYGAKLACASSDGSISVISYDGQASWTVEKIPNAHAIGCTGVSWAPAATPGALVSAGGGASVVDAKRLVTCGCDNLVKIWRFDEERRVWGCEATLSAHGDWVRDVAWSENMGLPMNTIASCGQDGKVFIWTQSEPRGAWQSRELHDFGAPVWRVSWSTMGNILAVSDGNNTVTVWKESLDGAWNQISAAA